MKLQNKVKLKLMLKLMLGTKVRTPKLSAFLDAARFCEQGLMPTLLLENLPRIRTPAKLH